MPKYKEIVAKVEVKPQIILSDFLKSMMIMDANQKIDKNESSETEEG